MNIREFTEVQLQALLDLALLAMYSDGHLAAVEDARVGQLLAGLGYDSDFHRAKCYDAAVARVRSHLQTTESARSYAALLAQSFISREQRRQVQEALNDVVISDRHVAAKEAEYMTVVEEALRL